MPATIPEHTHSASGAVLPPVPRYSRFPADSPRSHGDTDTVPPQIQAPMQAPHGHPCPPLKHEEAIDSGYSSGREYPEVPEYVYPSSRERRRAPDHAYSTARDGREAKDRGYGPRYKHFAVAASDYAAHREYQEVSDSDYHSSSSSRGYRERRTRREHRETSDSEYEDYAPQREYREVPGSSYIRSPRGLRLHRGPRETSDNSDSDDVAHPGHRGHRETYNSDSDARYHLARRHAVRSEPRETPDFVDSEYAAHLGRRKRREHRGEPYPGYDPRPYHKEPSDLYYNSDHYAALREHREAPDPVYRRPARGHRRRRREQRQGAHCDCRRDLPPTVASDPGPGASPTFNSRPFLPPTSNSLPAHAPTTASVPAMLATAKAVPAPAPPPNPSWVSVVDECGVRIAAPAANEVSAQDTAPLDTIAGDASPVGVPPVDIVPSPVASLAIDTKQHMAAVPAPLPPSPPTAAAAAAAPVPRPPPAGSPHDARLPMGLASPTLANTVEDKRTLHSPRRSTACSILLCIHSSSRIRDARNYRISVFRGHRNGESTSDKDLFLQLRRAYNTELRSSWQRFFSLRGLKYISVVEYTNPESPVLLPLDGASRNSMLYAFNKPHKMLNEGAWVDWIFALKERPPHRYGLEFVQGWDGRKIVVLAAVPWVCSVITAVLWSVLAGDVQAAMAVASYILTASGVVLALLGILSTLEG